MFKEHRAVVQAPGLDTTKGAPEWAGRRLPADYLDLLAESNGFLAHGGAFRFFAYGEGRLVRDALAWNRAPWRSEYGDLLPAGTYIWAEDVFGDQYGYTIEGGTFRLAKFLCEGGELEPIPWQDVTTFLQREILSPQGKAVDMALVREALGAGLAPSVQEHLSFSLPLIYGGEYELSNLEVVDASAHLSLLGQMSRQNASLPEGASVRDFIK
jgi:Domain of unknown function (DUF1851)